jgi:putative endopeptidase
MGETRKKRKIKEQKKKPFFCRIPIQAPVFNSLSPSQQVEIGTNFYTWVNGSWLKETPIPEFENDFGVSEEVERCIYKESKKILDSFKESPRSKEEEMYKTLAESCLHSASQHTSVEFLKEILISLHCIQTVEDVVKHFAILNRSRFSSILNFQYHITPEKTVELCIDSNSPGLPGSYYHDREKIQKYKESLKTLGKLLDVPQLEKIFGLERTLVYLSNELWSSEPNKCKGTTLLHKFPKFPWDIWFINSGLPDWKHMTLYYTSPRWIRKISKLLHEVPISYWKTYLARCYILNSIHFLPPPFDEIDFDFFGRHSQGQRTKLPQNELFVQIVHEYLQDSFSRIFWKYTGEESIVHEIDAFGEHLRNAAITRLETVEWLEPVTRKKAIEKVQAMKLENVRPSRWAPFTPLDLDSKNLLKNIFTLGQQNTQSLLDRIGKHYQYWEEGIYRVNAYYFNQNNELMIPYGTVIHPFYTKQQPIAWSYGALGSIIGHEMCHGFDEDGKDYNPQGLKKKWWTRKDNREYAKKTKQLIEVFNSEQIGNTHVNGEKTLSENIADLGGVGISLQALKATLEGVSEKEKLDAYRLFFIAFAVSWRTKVRHQKLKTAIGVDPHAPAYLRVNFVVNQFDEWYEAFQIPETSELYRKPEDRIRIF